MEKQHGGKTTKHLLSYVCSTDAAACEASMKNVHNALKKLPEIEEQETPKDAVEENWMSGTITFSTLSIEEIRCNTCKETVQVNENNPNTCN